MENNMNTLKITLSALVVTLLIAITPFNANAAEKKGTEIAETNWTKRCQKDAKTGKEMKNFCEIAKRIQVKGAGTRIAEMAIGFPLNKEGKKSKAARGVIILPLGILLESGVVMKIDDNKPASFKPRFCTKDGCVAYINLNEKILGTMKNGNKLNLAFRTSKGQEIKVVMELKGFTKGIKSIR